MIELDQPQVLQRVQLAPVDAVSPLLSEGPQRLELRAGEVEVEAIVQRQPQHILITLDRSAGRVGVGEVVLDDHTLLGR